MAVGLVVLSGLLIKGGNGLYGKGMVKGCDQLAKLAIDPMVQPECAMDSGNLVLVVTHPLTGEQRRFNVESGNEVQ